MKSFLSFLVALACAFISVSHFPAENRSSSSPRSGEESMFSGLRTVVYHVSDLQKAKEWYARASYQLLLELGAKEVSKPVDVGGGIIAATVLDPFGNSLGIIENPHFKLEK